MNSTKRTARIVGVLFITATVAGILSAVILGPIQNAPDYLAKVSANENLVLIGALFELIMAVAAAGIGVSMYPILRKHNQGIALGAAGFRLIECALFMVGVICLLSLLILSQEFVQAGAPDASYFQTLGGILLGGSAWVIGGISFCLGALLYNYLFYQSRLIPQWLSGFGLIAVTLGLVAYLLQFFSIDSNLVTILHLPTLVQEMVFAVWLIVKGFNPSAIASESQEQT